LVPGKFEFTKFDPVDAEKHLGCLENALNWIKSLKKLDIKGIRVGISFVVIANSAYNVQFCDRSEISELDRTSYALHREFLEYFTLIFFCLFAKDNLN
jgi:hypothetical protein